MSPEESSRSLRWWPAALLVLLGAVAIAWLWSNESAHRQSQVMQTLSVLMVVGVLLLVWLLTLSRLAGRVRLAWASLLAVLALAALALFRVRGVDGDLVPLVEWRWAGGSASGPAAQKTALALADADDYPQFLGPDRNGILPGVFLESDWVKYPPQEVWRRPVGEAWSAFAVVGNRALTQEQRGAEERVVCYELATGNALWIHADTTRYETKMGGIGPRATPTVDGGQVFTLGATGLLNALDLVSGRLLWQRDIAAENGTEPPPWGMSGSPLVYDNMVIVSAGGTASNSLVAYNRDSGTVVWAGGSDPAGYSSPQLARLGGVDQVLIFNRGAVVGHDPIGGQVLWRHPWPGSTRCVAQPVPVGDNRVLVSSGYGIGSALFEVKRDEAGVWQASVVWKSPRMKAKFSNLVQRENHIYGLDDGRLACMDLTDGQRKWKRGRYGHGQVLLVGDLLLVQTESGPVVLVQATETGHRELARLDAFDRKTWNNPILAGRYLLVRNDREAICYKLAFRQVVGAQ